MIVLRRELKMLIYHYGSGREYIYKTMTSDCHSYGPAEKEEVPYHAQCSMTTQNKSSFTKKERIPVTPNTVTWTCQVVNSLNRSVFVIVPASLFKTVAWERKCTQYFTRFSLNVCLSLSFPLFLPHSLFSLLHIFPYLFFSPFVWRGTIVLGLKHRACHLYFMYWRRDRFFCFLIDSASVH